MAQVYLPGEIIDIDTDVSAAGGSKIIGYGIEKTKDGFTACQPGLFRTQGNKCWISVQSKRYIPQKGDRVLGVVTAKMGDFYKVDIGSSDIAQITFTSFEGATKRNRPLVKTGDVLFARVETASKHLEPELTCVDSEFRARGLGVLNGGFLFKVSTHLARRLLSPASQLLKILGKDYKFEITIGMNGKIWLNGAVHKEVVDMYNIIRWSEYVLESKIAEYAEAEIRKAKGFVQMETS